MKKRIPNFVTLLNAACGCIGIGFVFKGDIVFASYMIGMAAVFDFLDGMLARLLHVKSRIGKELDSLADAISFGVLPGFIMFYLLDMCFNESVGWVMYIPFIAFLIPVLSVLRLAIFNTDRRQTNYFIGVPTPASAIFVASIPLILYFQPDFPIVSSLLANPGFLIGLVLILSFLLISPIPLFSLKFKDFSWSKNSIQYIFLILSLALLIIFYFVAIPIIFPLYILLSIIKNPNKI